MGKRHRLKKVIDIDKLEVDYRVILILIHVEIHE
jgi:hypothetical protein